MTRAKLLSNIKYSLQCVEWHEIEEKEIKKAFDKLKKDLKSLKPLQKENQELKEKADKYDELCKHNVMESQCFGDALIQGILDLNSKVIERNKKLVEKNEKLKKAIEILKRCDFWFNKDDDIFVCFFEVIGNLVLNQDEFDLLKEVFDNE